MYSENLEVATMIEEKNEVINEIEKEIEDIKSKQSGDLEIEIAEEPKKEENVSRETSDEKKPEVNKDNEYGQKVQQRIRKLVAEKKAAEEKAEAQEKATAELKARLEKLEQGSQKQVESDFNNRYAQTKQALVKATEEGDTQAQVNFQEQLADMRASMRVAELQKQQMAQQQVSPTVGKAQQTATNPAPPKAMSWWQENNWFNAQGFERETAAARAIDVQLDLEGHDKNSDDYYNLLNSRLQKIYPELISTKNVTENKPRAKSSNPVAPATGGSAYKGNRVRMTADQLRMARELGINDEKALKKYANEIQKSQRS